MAAMKTPFSPAVRMLEAFKYPALSDGILTLNITDMDFMIFVVCAWVAQPSLDGNTCIYLQFSQT